MERLYSILEIMKIKDIVRFHSETTTPIPDVVYHLYSLPSFDNNQTREELLGQDIQSNKFTVPNRCILFNKLNVRFKRIWRIDSDEDHKIASTEFLPLIIDENKVDFDYCFYLLASPAITDYLCGQNANTSGSHKRIDPTNFFNIGIKLPPLAQQYEIGKLLSSLDTKIKLNRQINQNLEAMAKQLYDYWFMQFDFPNEEGKPYKSSGGEMVWNEKLKREIPKEWEVLNLGQITTSYQQGLIRSNNQLSDSSEFGYLKMGDLDGKGQYSLQKLARTNATSEEVFLFSLHKGDFLINVRNSKEIVGKTCLIDYVEENTLFNHMLVRMSFDKVTSFYMNLLFNTDFMYRAMDGLKQGTTTVIALYQEDLYRLPIVVPTKNVMDTFSIIEKSILNQKELLTNEIISLIKQRDELLPLLMNGQVSVNSDLSVYKKRRGKVPSLILNDVSDIQVLHRQSIIVLVKDSSIDEL